MSKLESKKKNKKWIIFVIIGIVLIVGIVLGAIFISRAVKTSRSSSQIELGNKYLDELDYEEAIAHYNEAIAIDPTNLDAYIGIYTAYNALADQAIAELDYGQAVKYYDEAFRILKSGQEYIDSDELDEMVDEMRDKKKDAKAMRDGEDPEPGNIGGTPDPSPLSDSELAELTQTLNASLSNSNSDYHTMLVAMATQIVSDMQNNSNYFNISGVLSGDAAATAAFLLPKVDAGATHDYSADWCNHYYSLDSDTGCMLYAIPLADAASAAYSISGYDIDFTSYDWTADLQNTYIKREIYNGEDCLSRLIGGVGWIGNILSVTTFSDAEYIGDSTWRVVLTVHDTNSGDYGMAYDYDYCDVSFYLKPDEQSYFGFIITGYETANTQNTTWVKTYNEFLLQYKNSQSGAYMDYVTYGMFYLDGDDIPELLISAGGEYAFYVYTIKNGSVTTYSCSNYTGWDDNDNCLFIASGVGGTSGDIHYIPYSGKILIQHTDADYAGEVYYSNTQYFDGTQWYDVGDSMYFLRDQYGNIGENVQHDIEQGWIPAEEYEHYYDAPGYNSNDEWISIYTSYYLRNVYY